MEHLADTSLIASLFAIVGLTATVCVMLKSDRKLITQLLGSTLVVSISFSAHSAVVYTISVFVIATLVTELQFLEKIAALIWNRKEYWAYLSGHATKEEIEGKAKAEVEAELEKEDVTGEDEVEPVEEVEQVPDGITDIEEASPRKVDKNQLLLNTLQFEKSVLYALEKGNIPFDFKRIHKEFRLTRGGRVFIIDGIIETQNVHYLVEIKNIARPSGLVNAVHQVKTYKENYENFLRERKVRASVQPLIIVPDGINTPISYNGVPVVRFTKSQNNFLNFRETYPDYELNNTDFTPAEDLAEMLRSFLKKYSKWAFSPLRIQKWGSRQAGFEKFALYSTREIRQQLEDMLSDGILEERKSQNGNKLYRIKL